MSNGDQHSPDPTAPQPQAGQTAQAAGAETGAGNSQAGNGQSGGQSAVPSGQTPGAQASASTAPPPADTYESLRGKTFVVTGGNSGIGAEVCRWVGINGGNVIINWIGGEEANAPLVAEIEAAGGKAVPVRGDVSKVADVQALVDAAVKEFGRLDVMVNNAGIETRKHLLDSDEADFDKVIGVNLKGAYFGTQLAARQFISQGGPGVVINISSVHEDWPMPGNHAYCVSKGGIRMLTRNAGVELAEHGIRVVGVAPGAVATPINLQSPGWAQAEKELDEEIPLGRVAGTPEIASVVMFLASSGGSYLTATTVTVDGGITLESSGH